PAPAYIAEWSGFYVGIEGGYGWGRQRIDASGVGGFGGGGNVNNILDADPNAFTTLFPEFNLNLPKSVSQKGGLVGGFVGAQKQFGSWVFGIEIDADASFMKGTAAASSIERDVQVSQFRFGAAPVSVVSDPNQTRQTTGSLGVEITGGTITIPGR